jgi:hypothetical protein
MVDLAERDFIQKIRCVTPRPQSNNSFLAPASTRMPGPNRLLDGNGVPVHDRVAVRLL